MQSALAELKNFNESFEVIGESTKALATISEVLGDAKTKGSILAPILEKTKEISSKILDFVGFGEEIENKATRKTITSILSLLLLGGLLLWIFRKNVGALFGNGNTKFPKIDIDWFDANAYTPITDNRYYLIVHSVSPSKIKTETFYGKFCNGVWHIWVGEEGFVLLNGNDTVTHFYPVENVPKYLWPPQGRKTNGY